MPRGVGSTIMREKLARAGVTVEKTVQRPVRVTDRRRARTSALKERR